jgi:hydroxyacylglutathione hydrolase
MAIELVTLPCLQDNYAFLLRDRATGHVTLVDAPQEGPVLAELALRGLVAATGARVSGAAADAHRLPPLDQALRPGDSIRIGDEVGTVLDAPGHTLGHIAFHFPDSALIFTGDSLMAGGCGRLFEGSAAQMWQTLSGMARLPGATLVCSGHEYTQSNLKFAQTIEPQNPALISRIARVDEARALGRPTVPSRLIDEIEANPFLRAAQPAVKAALGHAEASDADTFAELRHRKDRF